MGPVQIDKRLLLSTERVLCNGIVNLRTSQPFVCMYPSCLKYTVPSYYYAWRGSACRSTQIDQGQLTESGQESPTIGTYPNEPNSSLQMLIRGGKGIYITNATAPLDRLPS
jgi:hypothetical protein